MNTSENSKCQMPESTPCTSYLTRQYKKLAAGELNGRHQLEAIAE